MKDEIQKSNGDLPATSLAMELYRVETQLASLENVKQLIRDDLLATMKRNGVKSVKLDNGDMYIRADRAGLVIKDEAKAFKWALENPEARMKINSSAALKAYKMGNLKFFAIKPTEYLRILRRGAKDETNGEVDVGS